MSESPFKIDIVGILAERRLGRFHAAIVGLCALALFVDGFDTEILNAAAPNIAQTLLVNPVSLGPVFSYGSLGILVGLLLGGPFADRIGRRRTIIGATMFFAVLTLLTAWANSVAALAIIRFVCGIGLGASIPGTLALAAEFMPRKHLITLTMAVWFGFAVGVGIAAPVASYVLETQRWPVLFWFGALVPVAILPILWTALPDSLLFIAREGEPANPRIRATLIRISRRYDRLRTNEFFSSEPQERGFPVWLLFREGRALLTALNWIMFGASLMGIFLVDAFLPRVLGNAALTESRAETIAAMTTFAGLFGGFVVAFLADRFDRYAVLAAAFFLGALAVVILGMARGGPLVAIAALGVGVFAIGTQSAANAVVTASYPTDMRASGIGWALGIGRNGQIVAPIIANLFIALRVSSGHLLDVIALPSLAAATAALVIALLRRRANAHAAEGAVLTEETQ